MHSDRTAGFTLIEVLIVVAIVAILAAIAIPAYADQMRKSRRAAAVTAMQDVQLQLERWRVDHADYSGSSATLTDNKYYKFTITAAAGTNNYSIAATAQGDQVKDKCGDLAITVTNGGRPSKTPDNPYCW